MALSRLQVLSVGLSPSTLEQGVVTLFSVRRAAGKLQVDGFLVISGLYDMSRNPVKF